MGQADQAGQPIRRLGRPPKVQAAPTQEAAGQSLALRIWSGQSVDVPVHERIARIRAGLAEQGLDTTGITLPHPDAGRYL